MVISLGQALLLSFAVPFLGILAAASLAWHLTTRWVRKTIVKVAEHGECPICHAPMTGVREAMAEAEDDWLAKEAMDVARDYAQSPLALQDLAKRINEVAKRYAGKWDDEKAASSAEERP